jgi:hypothetical protein
MATPPTFFLQRWLADASGKESSEQPHASPWWQTLWLSGVDYFSSLGYAPSLAVMSAGYLAPIATLLLVGVTFLCALPVYSFVARHSFEGQGSIKLIERLTVGWGRLGWIGKVLVLTLIGFAMTDFVITITLSTADATQHILENPFLGPRVPHRPVLLTSVLILGLCVVFLRGFREAVGLTMAVGIPYMIFNAVVIGAALAHIVRNPELFHSWWSKVVHFDAMQFREHVSRMSDEAVLAPAGFPGFVGIAVVSLLVFPKLALGLSGFETGVSVMMQIKAEDVRQRIVNTRKLLATAAVLMSIELVGANFVATVAIPEEAYARATAESLGGEAAGRSLAYLAHELFGDWIGSAYDVITVLVLATAGASAMAGLLNILPRFLPRFGMSPTWLEYRRPLVLLITLVCLVVTYLFHADVTAQGGAYATGVLVLMTSDSFGVMLAEWKRPRLRRFFALVMAVFAYVLVINVWERPDGIKIAAVFIFLTIAASVWSRWMRSSELRVPAMRFVDDASQNFWLELKGIDDVVLVPLRSPTGEARASSKAREIHPQKSPDTVYAFLHVSLLEDTSQFQSPLRISVSKAGNDYVIEVADAVAVANAIAYVALELQVTVVIIGLLDQGTPLANALLYLLFGTGEVGYAVRAIFMRMRHEWLEKHDRELERLNDERDRLEKEALRDMVVLEDHERRVKLHEMFALEQKRFAEQLPKLKRLPHLIMFE